MGLIHFLQISFSASSFPLPPVCINLVWKVDFIPTVLQADITAVSLEFRPVVWSRPAAHTD